MAHVANVKIDNTKVAGDLTDFPVYVNLADLPSTFWDTVANGGGDIRVFKSDGTTELPREVVSCDTSTETGELHFKYTGTLSGSTDTEVQIHADGTSADYAVTDTYGRNNVWTGYKAVYHLNTTNDSTSNGKNLTTAGTVSSATGKIGGGASADWNATNHYRNTALLGSNLGTSNASFSCWFKKASAPTNDFTPTIMRLGDRIYVVATKTTGRAKFLTFDGVSGYTETGSVTDICDDSWHHLVGVRNGTNVAIYVDGSLSSDNTDTVRSISGDEFNIGTTRNATYDNLGNATIDETRVLTSALSSDWITTEYNNQSDTSTFYTAKEPVINIDAPTLEITATLNAPTLSIQDELNVLAPILEIDANLLEPTISFTDSIDILTPTLELDISLFPPKPLYKLWENQDKPTTSWDGNLKPTSIWTTQTK